MKNRVKVTIAALTIGVLAMCGNMTGYATESADAVSTQANEDGSTDAGGSNQNIYTVTYNLNGGTKDGKPTYRPTYNSESWTVDLSKITPERDGYRLTGWWYTDTNGTEQEIDTNETINLEKVFPDIREATLTAEWTQVVTVTVDENSKPDEVAAGNTISVKTASSNTLNLDKWIVNASDANNGWELKPNNNEGTIKVEPAAVEKHVINVDGEKTGFGITKDNAKANFVSYWSPKNGYLIKVQNKIGHPLNLDNKKIASGTTSDALGIMSVLPRESDTHFVIENYDVAKYMEEATSEYIKYEGNHVLCNTITLEPKDVQRKIIVVYPESNEVKFSGRFNQILKNGETLSVQSLLDNSTLNGQKNEAKKEGFTKYRWTYSVKDADENWISAKEIPSGAWSEQSSEETDILNKKFGYSFPYYEFEFEPVWQGDVNFKLEVPEGEEESVLTPKPIEGIDVGTTIELPKAPEIKGYTFNGWKSDVSTDAVYEPGSSYKVTSANVTFTGSWTVNKYSITWKQGDNEPVSDSWEVAYKSQVKLPIPEKTGYTFTGWKSDVEGDNTLYNKETPFTMPSHAITMTAQWQINTYTVTYNGNGGTIGIYTGRDDVTYNASYKIKNVSGITPTRFGYQFCGWKINGSGDTLQAGSSFTMPAKDVTLVAQWEATSSKSYKMEQGVGYTYNGTFRIKGDPSNYQDKITFYVPKAGEYTFE